MKCNFTCNVRHWLSNAQRNNIEYESTKVFLEEMEKWRTKTSEETLVLLLLGKYLLIWRTSKMVLNISVVELNISTLLLGNGLDFFYSNDHYRFFFIQIDKASRNNECASYYSLNWKSQPFCIYLDFIAISFVLRCFFLSISFIARESLVPPFTTLHRKFEKIYQTSDKPKEIILEFGLSYFLLKFQTFFNSLSKVLSVDRNHVGYICTKAKNFIYMWITFFNIVT